MCIVSMVIDNYPKQWPKPIQDWPYQQAIDFSEVLRRLAELDKKLGAKDCYEPKKDEVVKQLKDRITELEKELKPLKDLQEAVKAIKS